MKIDLSGKRALVFGGSTGIGFAVADALSKSGATVMLCSRNEKNLVDAQRKISNSHFIIGDLSKSGEAKRVVAETAKKLGGLDILVSNTGGPPTGSMESISEEQWLEGFQSLWLSTSEAIQAALPAMKKQLWGRILLIASTSAKEPIANLTVSNGLRAGLLGLMKSLSNEVAALGITANTILPGFINTERLQELGLKEADILKQIPMNRLGRPEEVGALAAFLGSDLAAYLTGQAIPCDGGRLRSY